MYGHAWRYTSGILKDALRGAFWPIGLCAVPYLLGRRGPSYVLCLAKHDAEFLPPGYQMCLYAGITHVFVALSIWVSHTSLLLVSLELTHDEWPPV